MTTRGRIASVFTTLALLTAAAAAHAGGVVGSGTAASCTAAAFAQALAGGGSVSFDCGPAPLTLTLPQRQTIAADTTIAGDDRITLSGAGAHALFGVPAGRTLTLERLVLTDAGGENWAVLVADGATLTATGVTLQSCSRGGIYNAGGVVTVADSLLAANDASSAGAAITNENGGELTVLRSTFYGNLNGAVYSAGPTTVADSAFSDNHGDSAGGGAIVHSKALEVTRCRFDGNQAVAGGAIYTSGDLVVTDSTFRRNQATLFEGGAIQLYNQTQTASSVTVRASTFTENVAERSGGGLRCDAPNGGCTVENVTFSRNAVVQDGGAAEISLKSGALQATHVTVLAGGSPAVERVAGTLTLRNSVIDDGACAGAVADAGGNVQGQPGLCAASFQSGDPALFALAGNGGRTPTHELGTSSAALHAAADGCLPTDQRGVARPATGCDAGAFQRGAVPTLALLVPDHTAAGGPAFSLVVQGTSFLAGEFPTVVRWNGTLLATVASSPIQLVVEVPAALIASAGVATVTVETPNPPVPDGGAAAQGLPFTVDAALPPPPPPPPAAGPCDGLAGYDAVLCALAQARMPEHFCAAAELDAKLARALDKSLGKAATLVGAARDASGKKVPRLLKRARAQLTKLARRAGGKRARATTPACRTAVVDGTNGLAARVAGLAQ